MDYEGDAFAKSSKEYESDSEKSSGGKSQYGSDYAIDEYDEDYENYWYDDNDENVGNDDENDERVRNVGNDENVEYDENDKYDECLVLDRDCAHCDE